MGDPLTLQQSVLVLAPTGRDATLLAETLSADELAVCSCRNIQELVLMLERGAATAIIAEEALCLEGIRRIQQWVVGQPPWSDMPFVVLTSRGVPRPSTTRRAREFEALGNVTFLERPVRPETVRSSMRAAVRARLRQYEMRDRQEILARVNSDLEQFAYSASHDLKEPIRNIAIYSELLTLQYRDVLDQQGLGFLQFIISGAKKIEFLVNDLLLYTQAASTAEQPSESSEAEESLKAALEFLGEAVRESGTSITHGPLPQIRICQVHLQQLFQNLIENAIKYRRESPHIHVSARDGAPDGSEEWIFSIEDNGIGFDPVYKEQIFGIFKRLHTNAEYSGTGMGLAICQRIVQRYRGRIWADSEPGKGSIFSFAIPK